MKIAKLIGVFAIFALLISCSGKKQVASDSVAESAEVDTEVVDTTATTEEVNDSLPSVIDFYATWCGPCHKMEPVFEQLKEEYKGRVNFVSIDVDQYPYDAKRFGIEAMPTFVFLNAEGDEVDRLVGADENALKQNVASLAEMAANQDGNLE